MAILPRKSAYVPRLTRSPHAAIHTASDERGNPLLVLYKNKPPGQNDGFPVPRGYLASVALKTWTDPLKQQFLNKDQFFYEPGRGANYDWQLPPIAQRPGIDLRFQWDGIKFLLNATATPFPQQPNDWPNPVLARKVQTPDYTLIDFALLPQMPPPGLSDWPLPKRLPYSLDLKWGIGGERGMIYPLLPVVRDPFFQTDWQRFLVKVIWQDQLPINLQTSTIFGGVSSIPFPFPSDFPNPRLVTHVVRPTHYRINDVPPPQPPPNMDDWPQPVSSTYWKDLRWMGWLATPMLPTAVNPFVGNDSPHQRSAPFPIEGRTYAQLAYQCLYPLKQDPFKNYDQPNPRGYSQTVELKNYTWPMKATIPLIGIPFVPLADPNPKGYGFPLEGRTFLDPLKLKLLGKDQFFGVPGEPLAFEPPPNPVGYPFPITNRGAGDIAWAAFYVQPPFYLTDYPNPLGYVAGVNQRTFLQQMAVNLRGLDQFFYAPGDGPDFGWQANPLRPDSKGRDLFNFTISYPLGLKDPQPFPLQNSDNPRGYGYPLELRTWAPQDNLAAGPLSNPPSPQKRIYDWPNPLGYVFPIGNRGYIWFLPNIYTYPDQPLPSSWFSVGNISGVPPHNLWTIQVGRGDLLKIRPGGQPGAGTGIPPFLGPAKPIDPPQVKIVPPHIPITAAGNNVPEREWWRFFSDTARELDILRKALQQAQQDIVNLKNKDLGGG